MTFLHTHLLTHLMSLSLWRMEQWQPWLIFPVSWDVSPTQCMTVRQQDRRLIPVVKHDLFELVPLWSLSRTGLSQYDTYVQGRRFIVLVKCDWFEFVHFRSPSRFALFQHKTPSIRFNKITRTSGTVPQNSNFSCSDVGRDRTGTLCLVSVVDRTFYELCLTIFQSSNSVLKSASIFSSTIL